MTTFMSPIVKPSRFCPFFAGPQNPILRPGASLPAYQSKSQEMTLFSIANYSDTSTSWSGQLQVATISSPRPSA